MKLKIKFMDKFELDYKNLALKFPITSIILFVFFISNLTLFFIYEENILVKYLVFFYSSMFLTFSFENLKSKFYKIILIIISIFIFIKYLNIDSYNSDFFIYLVSILVIFVSIFIMILSHKNKISDVIFTIFELFFIFLILNIFILLFILTLNYFFNVGNFKFGLFLNSLSFIFIIFLLYDNSKKQNEFMKFNTLIKITDIFIISYSLLLLAYFVSKFISEDDFSVIHLSLWFSLFTFILFILKEKNSLFIKFLILTLVLICTITILQRIYTYGFTENRILILFLSLYLTLNLGLLILNKISNLAVNLPIILFIIIFIFSPLNLKKISIHSQLKIYNSLQDSQRKSEIYEYLVKRNVKNLEKPNLEIKNKDKFYKKNIKFYDVKNCSKMREISFYDIFDENNRTFYIKNDDFNIQISENEMLDLLKKFKNDENSTYIKINNIYFYLDNFTLYESKINYIEFYGYCY